MIDSGFSIKIIVAMDINGAIGNNNQLLWSIPKEMKHFKETTNGKTVVMGRKTAESIGRSLPNRNNIVLTSQSAPYDGQKAASSIDEAITIAKELGESDIYVIGGGEIYRQFSDLADTIILTTVDTEVEEFDAQFVIDWSKWDSIDETFDSDNGYDFSIQTLVRRV